MARMFDTTNPAAIPASAGTPDYAAGYVDGHWQTFLAMAAKYPSAVHVSITAIPGSSAGATAHVCDCEPGGYTPAQAASWALARQRAGVVPAIYCSLSAWSTVVAACKAAGVELDLVDYWIAAYPGNGPNLYAFTVAHQYVDHGTYDESVVVEGWAPGRPIAPPAPAPTPYGDAMTKYPTTVAIGNGEGWIPSPVPVGQVVSVVVEDENPEVVGRYDSLPVFTGKAAQAGPNSPNGALVFKGSTDGTFGVEIWAAD